MQPDPVQHSPLPLGILRTEMKRRDLTSLAGGGGVLLALCGLWLGHAAEYVRVWGTQGIDQVLFGSVHAYMLPLAALLAFAALGFGVQLGRVWLSLGRRLDSGRWLLAALLRGRRPDAEPAIGSPLPTLTSRVLAAWPAVITLQVALYVIQENVEAAAGGRPAPGISVITGVHALAPLVHAGVSLAMLLAVAALLRIVRGRASQVAAVETTIRALLARVRRAPFIRTPPSEILRSPLRLLGFDVQRRPPPATLPV
jgi:hypothetical protein